MNTQIYYQIIEQDLQWILKKYPSQVEFQVKSYLNQVRNGSVNPVIEFVGIFSDHLAFHSAVVCIGSQINKKG